MRDDASSLEVSALVQQCTKAYLSLYNINEDATLETWFGHARYAGFNSQALNELGLDDDVLEGFDIKVSAVSFAESDEQETLGEHYELIPSIRANCRFELPITKTRAELEARTGATRILR